MKKRPLSKLLLMLLPAVMTTAQANDGVASRFNPALSVVIEGGFAATGTNSNDYAISGFDIDHPEGRVEGDGFYTGHNEITFSSNVDDLFFGQLTAVIAEHDDEVEVELEEAFLQTIGLPYGLSLKAGRMLPIAGYLNEKHLHEDFFIERPLVYQAFLGGHFFDDGLQLSLILPTDFYSEIGGGVFRGGAYPATSSEGIGLTTAYARVGGDINSSTSWRLGISSLFADPDDREAGHGHGHDHGGGDDHGELAFSGESRTFAIDGKVEWAPNGNSQHKKLELRGEYFYRDEDGHYDDGDELIGFDGQAHGFYAMAAYKFHRNWSVGARYDHLFPEDDIDDELEETPLDSEGLEPKAGTILLQYAPSEFSRIRASYTLAEINADEGTDDRFFINFILSLGSHSAHKY